MTTYPPVELVKYAATKLGELCDELIFLGGAVVGLLVTEPGSRAPRPTQDVDVTVQIGTITEYYSLNDSLLSKGFVNDINGPICRYSHGLLKLDVMPVSPDVLGFSNRWYQPRLKLRNRIPFQMGKP